MDLGAIFFGILHTINKEVKNRINIKSILPLFIIFSFSIESYSQLSNIDLSNVSSDQKQEIKAFSYDSFTVCQDGKELPNVTARNASSYFRKRYNLVKLIENCNWYNERFGEIEAINLEQVLFDSDKQYKIFRFKVKRSKSDMFSEIRTTLDKNDKYVGLITKGYWSDKYYAWRENPKLIAVDTLLLNDSILNQNKEFAYKSYNICDLNELFKVDSTNGVYRSIRKGWSASMLKECDSIKIKNGNFNNLKLQQVLTDSISTNVYRYKINFDKLEKPSEIRVYSNINNKYSGIFVVDIWYDKYFILKEALEKTRNDLGN